MKPPPLLVASWPNSPRPPLPTRPPANRRRSRAEARRTSSPRRAEAAANRRVPPAKFSGRISSRSLGAIVIYLFIKTLFVEAFRIPSGSMIPTLLVGDWLFVNKLAYGPTIPFTNSHLPGYTSPKHGDVIVFVSPYQADNAPDFTPTLVKRLIGMPGDTLLMRDGVLSLNGVPAAAGFAAIEPEGRRTALRRRTSTWQHNIEVKGSRFGPPPDATHARQLGTARHSRRSLFHDGRQPLLLEGQSLLGRRAEGNIRGRPLFVYYSYVPGPAEQADPCTGQVSDRAASGHYRHSLDAHRTLGEMTLSEAAVLGADCARMTGISRRRFLASLAAAVPLASSCGAPTPPPSATSSPTRPRSTRSARRSSRRQLGRAGITRAVAVFRDWGNGLPRERGARARLRHVPSPHDGADAA